MATIRAEHAHSPEFITLRGAARALGVGERQLRRAVEAGELATYPIGAWPRLRVAEVFAWANSKQRRALPPTARTEARLAELEAQGRL